MDVGVFGFGNRKGRDVYQTSLMFSAEHLLPMSTLDGPHAVLVSAGTGNVVRHFGS